MHRMQRSQKMCKSAKKAKRCESAVVQKNQQQVQKCIAHAPARQPRRPTTGGGARGSSQDLGFEAGAKEAKSVSGRLSAGGGGEFCRVNV